MDLPSFSERVLLNEDRFTDFEDELSRYILDNMHDAADSTVSSLSTRYYVSPNAVVRYARKLGYSGFSEMRISLKHEVETAGDDPGAEGAGGAGESVSTGLSTSRELVLRTYALRCDKAQEAKACRMLHEADEVVFFAVGETAYAAHDFARIFGSFDKKSQFITYENQARYEIDSGRKLLLFILSLSGETRQVVELAQYAHDRDVPIVSMTHLTRNTVSTLSTLSLHCCSPRRYIQNVNVTDLTPLFAAMTSLQDVYLADYR